jgi:hypothetical protein
VAVSYIPQPSRSGLRVCEKPGHSILDGRSSLAGHFTATVNQRSIPGDHETGITQFADDTAVAFH